MEKLVYGICYGSETVFVCFGDMRQALFIVGHSFCHGRLREWVITLKFHGLPKVHMILRGKFNRRQIENFKSHLSTTLPLN